MSEYAQQYKVRLIRNTRPHRVQGRAARTVKEYIRVGISPRVHFHLEAVARTFAFFNGDMMITPDHIKAVAEPVLAQPPRAPGGDGVLGRQGGPPEAHHSGTWRSLRGSRGCLRAVPRHQARHQDQEEVDQHPLRRAQERLQGRRVRHRRRGPVAARPAPQGHRVDDQPADLPREALPDRADGAEGAPDADLRRFVDVDPVPALPGLEQGPADARSDRQRRPDAIERPRPGRPARLLGPGSSCS